MAVFDIIFSQKYALRHGCYHRACISLVWIGIGQTVGLLLYAQFCAIKKFGGEQMDDMLEIKTTIEGVCCDIHGLTSLIHLMWEAVRSGSVGIDEVASSLVSLLILAENVTNNIKDVKEKFVI